MKLFHSSKEARAFAKKGSVVAIGNYDGLHLGHRAILKLIVKEARKRKVPAVLYTFEPHPVKLLAKAMAPKLINTLEQKSELLKETGIDAVVIEPFDKKFSGLSPDAFLKGILQDRLNALLVAVGTDFTFGARRAGNIETLEIFGFKSGIEIRIVKPVFSQGLLVSSSVVRKLIASGKVDLASKLLTRPFFLDGRIVHGDGRGHKIGFPTANLKTENELAPARGVYATRLRVGKKTVPSVTNIGVRPTFGENKTAIETHMLTGMDDIYGKSVRLYFVKRLRDEKKFASTPLLTRQIKRDIAKARSILK